MIEVTRSPEEVMLDYVVGVSQEDRRRLDDLGDYARGSVESGHRLNLPSGPRVRLAQVSQAIGPRSGSTVGTGWVFLCVLIGTTLYRQYPRVGDATLGVPVVNTAISASSIVVNSLVWIEMVDGQWLLLWQDCNETSPSAFADQPH